MDKLNELSNVIIQYKEEYKYIQDTNNIVKKEYNRILEEEKLLVKQQVKNKIHDIIKKLEQSNKLEEIEIIKESFKDEIEYNIISFNNRNIL
jgi:hypothetical protein